jgi:8-oxo-dGTP diphosphatase
MPEFKVIRGEKIKDALLKTKRQYLAGHLGKAQMLKHIDTTQLEIGISDYEGGEFEAAHFHPTQTEFQLILSGETEYYDITNDKPVQFKEGDFYCIETNTKYAQIILKKTRILFIKTPSINDKTLCDGTIFYKAWLESHSKTVK